jgi:hypothetical protein
MHDLTYYAQATVMVAALVFGAIGAVLAVGWGLTTGLRTVGGLLGSSPSGGRLFTCATCGHKIEKHYTGRWIRGIVTWLHELGPCQRCACPDYESWASV